VVLGMGTVDHRVDIYALGCVAYWLLTGRLVFEAQTAMQVMIQHANATPVAPSARVELEIPAALDAVVLACLAKNPNDRPASARELALRLSQAVGGTGWTQEEALRWWERHRPESMRPVPTNAGGLTLEKTLGPGWTL
jgi:serine/threonine-protein kinase